jgi:aminomethyltransferase
MIAVQGPNARAKVWQAFPQLRAASERLAPFSAALVGETMVARTGYTGEDGFEIALPAGEAAALWTALAAAGVRPCGLGARDTLRLEAGMNLYGQDMDERVSPLDAGLGWTVDRADGRDFVGRAALEARGQRHEFLGLVLLDGGGVLRGHQKVEADAGAGEVTSGTFSPTLARSIALARLPRGTTPGATVRVQVRDKSLAARVVKPVFVRHGRSLVDNVKEAP